MEQAIFQAIRQKENARLLELVTPASLTVADQDGVTPLLFAATEGRPGAVHILVQAGASLFQIDKGGRTAFLCAAAEGHEEICTILFASNPGTARSCTKVRAPAAEGACSHGVATDRSRPLPLQAGNSAMHRAAAYGRTHLIPTLIQAGCPLNSVNNAGETPLGRAARWGHASTVKVLLDAGADPAIADSGGTRPADWAQRKGFEDVASILDAFIPPQGGRRRSIALRDAGLAAGLSAEEAAQLGHLGAARARGASLTGPMPPLPETAVAPLPPSAAAPPTPLSAEEERLRSFADWGEEEVGPATVEGWMYKQGHIIKNWKRRWFVLEERTIRYYATPTSAKPKGTIVLVPDTEVFVEARYPKPNSFTILTPAKRFVLNCECEGAPDAGWGDGPAAPPTLLFMPAPFLQRTWRTG